MDLNKLPIRTLLVIFMAIALTVVTLAAAFVNISQFSRFYYSQTETELLPNALGRLGEEVRSEINRPILLSTALSQNSFLHEWTRQADTSSSLHQQSVDFLASYGAQNEADAVFWVSALDQRYYTQNGFFKEMSAQDSRDSWFFDFMNSDESVQLNIDPDEQSGALTLFVNTRVEDPETGQPLAAAGLGFDVTEISQMVAERQLGERGYIFLVDQQNHVIAHSDNGFIGRALADISDYQPLAEFVGQQAQGFRQQRVTIGGEEVYVGVTDVDGTGLNVVGIFPVSEVSSEINAVSAWALLVSLLLAVGFVVASIFFANNLSKKIRRVGDQLLSMSGDGGDLTVRLDDSANNELGHLAKGFNAIIGTIGNMVENIKESQALMKKDIDTIGDLTGRTADATNEQGEQTDQVATAINEMGQTVADISSIANRTADNSESALTEVTQTSQSMSETSTAMHSLNELINNTQQTIAEFAAQAEAIDGVVEVINNISEQTNLLALNAAIEAARAGEQGRGFSVVADEVRTLAQRTKTSTAEIQEQVAQLQALAAKSTKAIQQGSEDTETVTQLTERSAQSLKQVEAAFQQISDGNHQVATATEEQSSVVEHVNQSAHAIRESALEINDNLKQQRASMRHLSELADHMNALVSQFKV
ncbi:methyl-accepting chemotaxis protein [Aliidiomarina soli]|uniref:methyl-accepting chemotaxis protein n=1 Tax=Aliidiomarina soli TaxID=1928574 RepID=UPI0018E55589|nr:methyl-accepting chemotaxis protein [Aliidiomarina soli]